MGAGIATALRPLYWHSARPRRGYRQAHRAILRCGVPTAAVLVGQAFHWFDPDHALTEIARVLRPGGVLAAIGYIEDESVGWVAELTEATQAARPAGSIRPRFADVPEHPSFGKLEQRQFRWRWPRTLDSLLDTTSTHSWALVSSPAERAAAMMAIRRALQADTACMGDGHAVHQSLTRGT